MNLTVNGRPVPFNMKVGEAGEAFFIFETAGDVPDDLITSPLLSAIRSPDLEPQGQDPSVGRFGAKSPAEEQTPSQTQINDVDGGNEPDFLDLDAIQPQPPSGSGLSLSKPADESESTHPSSLLTRTAGVGAAVLDSVIQTERGQRRRLNEKVKAAYNLSQNGETSAEVEEGDELMPNEGAEEPSEPIYNGGKSDCFL